MSTIELSNEYLRLIVNTKGAEAVSLKSKKDGMEYLWTGEETIWPWHAPVLFPVCGNYPCGYEINGRKYNIRQHGFLRDEIHSYHGHGVFSYVSEPREDYPFTFRAVTTFSLVGNKLFHKLEIENLGINDMPCSYGFHTGFLMPSATICIANENLEINEKTLSPIKCLEGMEGKVITVKSSDGKSFSYSALGINNLVFWSKKGCYDKFISIEARMDTVWNPEKNVFATLLKSKEKRILEEGILIE